MDLHHDYIAVPEVFWSFETGKPISHCKLCDCDLMEPGTNYLIEKAFKNGETIFEHALCLSCYTESHQSMSEDSREKIRDYFAEHVNMDERQNIFMEQYGTEHEKWIDHCMVKGFPVREIEEYQLYGFCIDKDLVFSGAPYVLCGDVIEEIMELLSAETLGTMNALSQKLFGVDAPHDLLMF
ncbi:hypothetical protein P4B35_19120 [Pontiellaceae bacterium B12227]|nr:hypothetical protein [Pontiellaceae bacterium B12227]